MKSWWWNYAYNPLPFPLDRRYKTQLLIKHFCGGTGRYTFVTFWSFLNDTAVVHYKNHYDFHCIEHNMTFSQENLWKTDCNDLSLCCFLNCRQQALSRRFIYERQSWCFSSPDIPTHLCWRRSFWTSNSTKTTPHNSSSGSATFGNFGFLV